MEIHYPHPYTPANKSVIHRVYDEECTTKCPIIGSSVKEKRYIGRFVDYTYLNKKGKPVYVERYCLLVTWID